MKQKMKIIFSPYVMIGFILVFNMSCKKDQIQKSDILFNPNLLYETISDNDGNVYKTIKIGTQTWMAENLKTNKYNNGDQIATTDFYSMDISNESMPKYQWAYGNFEKNVVNYGRLYTWFVLNDSRGICPSGWHIPTDSEWTTLITYLNGENIAGDKLKETGTIHWVGQNLNVTNESGFTALPAGSRFNSFSPAICSYGGWWSSTEAIDTNAVWVRYITSNSSIVFRDSYFKSRGLSIRCIKN